VTLTGLRERHLWPTKQHAGTAKSFTSKDNRGTLAQQLCEYDLLTTATNSVSRSIPVSFIEQLYFQGVEGIVLKSLIAGSSSCKPKITKLARMLRNSI